MQIQVNSTNIKTFGVVVKFDIYNRKVIFDTSSLTVYNTGGAANVQGIAFSLIDQDGISLATIDWTNPQLPRPNLSAIYTLDLSSVNYAFLFQAYQITAAIKEANGTIYTTPAVYKTICQPTGITDTGYVNGIFQVTADCPNNILTVKELTLLTYNNLTPSTTTKTGSLYYPTGTIAAVSFTNTPFSNNVIYTGQYNITCTTVGEYPLNDDVYVDVTYLTNAIFSVTCANKMADLMCCISGMQDTYRQNCSNAIGQRAKQQLDEITVPFLIGISKEVSGSDASEEAKLIKKILNCDCGINAIQQNQLTPINPSIYNIIVQGANGATVTSTTVGSTKTFTVSSNTFQVVKGDITDLAYSIVVDNTVAGVTKYKITFDYNALSTSVLNAIQNNPTLLNQLNTMIAASGGVSLTGLNGKCVINTVNVDYILTQAITNSTLVLQTVIDGNIYTAPANLYANTPTAVQNWLNSLSKGTFTVTNNAGNIVIQAPANTHTLSSVGFYSPTVTTAFTANSKTFIQFAQAVVDYLCNMTALQVGLGANLSLCQFDYNGNIINVNFVTGTNNQNDFNNGVANAICNIVNRMNTLTGVTCAKIQSLFSDYPSAVFSTSDRFLAVVAGNCTTLTNKQMAMAYIAAVGLYSDVKAAHCAISCSTPALCPDVAGISLNMSGSNIGIYGITWASLPSAVQSVSVKWKLHSATIWNVSTNALLILPNGNISGTSPYIISGVATGQYYDVWIQNNCGGNGFIGQITTPTGQVYTGSYRANAVIYNVCTSGAVTFYSSAPFGSGVTLYTNVGLTTPVTGYNYITDSSGVIYQISSTTGVVGANTGSSCATGTAGSYIVGNSTATICNGGTITLYTNGPFAVGSVLYQDSALSNPLTGYSYVVNASQIYNLNSTTGAVGAATGSSCNNNTVHMSSSLGGTSLDSVIGISGFTPSPGLPLLPGGVTDGTHNAFTGGITLNISGTPVQAGNAVLYKNGIKLQCIDVPSAGSYTFSSNTFTLQDSITISLNLGTCAMS